jgi:hypothetical protein
VPPDKPRPVPEVDPPSPGQPPVPEIDPPAPGSPTPVPGQPPNIIAAQRETVRPFQKPMEPQMNADQHG